MSPERLTLPNVNQCTGDTITSEYNGVNTLNVKMPEMAEVRFDDRGKIKQIVYSQD